MIEKNKIDELFVSFGCLKKTLPSGDICYMRDGVHYCFEYVNGLNAYVLETADNSVEAKKNRFEDNEIYSADLDENEIISKLKNDLIQFYNFA